MQVQLKSLHNISEVFSMKTNHIFGYTRLVTPRKKKKKKRIPGIFEIFHSRPLQLCPAESFIEPMTYFSVTLWTKSQHFSTAYYFEKRGMIHRFPFFFFLHFCCIHNKSDICMDNILKSLRTGSNCYYQSSLCSRNHNLPQFFHSIIEQNNSALREKCKITK